MTSYDDGPLARTNLWATPPSADLSGHRHEPPDYLPGLLVAGRRRTGRNQTAAARAAGVSRSYLSRLERGQRCPSIVVADALARSLHLTDAERSAVCAAGVEGVGRDWCPSDAEGEPGGHGTNTTAANTEGE